MNNRLLRPGYLKVYKKWDELWRKGLYYEADLALRKLHNYVKRYGMYQ